MRIGFITPSLFCLAPRWQRDPQIVKLAVPTLSGFLRAHGYDQIRQYDFEVQVFDLVRNEPGQLDLSIYFDDAKVDAFLQGDHPLIRSHSELLVDTLEIEEADVFAFSCASVLEVYADMHTAGNINMCMSKILKERFPNSKTVVGGYQISPESRQRDEYMKMLSRCRDLDYTIEGKGEVGLVLLLMALNDERSLEESGVKVENINCGHHMLPTYESLLHVPGKIAKEEGVSRRIREVETPEEKPEGDHQRADIVNPSIYVTPYFDPKNIENRKVSGIQILKRYNLDHSWIEHMAEFHDDQIFILPSIFMEGCNSQCAFCGYSMSKMAKRNISDVIRGLAWMQEKYNAKYFHFLNTNINGYYKYAETFCDEVINAKLDLLWSDCGNLWALDEKLIDKMRESGCIRLTFGVECPSDKMLKYIHKGINVEKIHQRLVQCHEAGIWNHVLLITGLPHETPEDTKVFVDFLEQSADYVHGYSISSFYLIASSLMGAFPQRYGIEVESQVGTLLEDVAFREIDGLDWSTKKNQIVESTMMITEAIRRIKKDPKYWSGAIDLEFLFWLYDRLGHDRKADIVRAYEEAFIGAPAHPKGYQNDLVRLMEDHKHPSHNALSSTPWRPDKEGIEIKGEALILPLRAGEEHVDIELRCHEFASQKPTVTAGQSLGVHANGRPFFTCTVQKLIEANGPFEQALLKVGWSINDREAKVPMNAAGFVITKDDAKIILSVEHLAPGQPAAVTVGDLGFSYRTPHGLTDVTQDPAVMRFLMRMGKYLLDQVSKAHKGHSPPVPLTTEQLEAFAEAVISDLEAPYSSALGQEESHEYSKISRPGNWGPGERHGNKFSMVPPNQ